MSNKERKKEISKQPIPTIEECLGFYKELTNLADVRFVPFYKMAIEALEKEPCEDCISRQTLDEIKELMTDINGDTVYAVRMSDLRQLPSVTPQPKMGKWINKYAEDACGERYSYWACSECGRDVGFNLANIEDVLSDYPYCHCGAKMVESQEREVEE